MRDLRPDLEVEWLTQSPVAEFLEKRGESVHPASRFLASESGHFEAESGEHDLHAFDAVRRMDEVLVNNFMVFDDLVERESFDLWVGDEAWDLDHFLHEHPSLKRSPFVWMTDFVGWVPMPDGGEREAFLTADYNAEMVEHVARAPGLRDRSVFVGDPDDIVDLPLGPHLPTAREWTEQHFDFAGYVMGERPDPARRDEVRDRLGYGPGEVVCLVSVGGSGVGHHLLRRVAAAYGPASALIPGLRMVVVTGPRIDPDTLALPAGVEVHGFLPDLDLHHAACDVAVVQGGLSTTMELTAARRPFLYVPLEHHFEQQVHVRHRLTRHRAGRALAYAETDPERVADELAAAWRSRWTTFRCPPTGPSARRGWHSRCSDPPPPAPAPRPACGPPATRRSSPPATERSAGRPGRGRRGPRRSRQEEVGVGAEHPGPAGRAVHPGQRTCRGLRVLTGHGRERRGAQQPPRARRAAPRGQPGPATAAASVVSPARTRVAASSPAAQECHQGWSTADVSSTARRPRRRASSRSPATWRASRRSARM